MADKGAAGKTRFNGGKEASKRLDQESGIHTSKKVGEQDETVLDTMVLTG